MFNLNEEWKKAYDLYLDEQYDNMDKNMAAMFEELESVQNDIALGFTSLTEYFNMLNEEGALGPVEIRHYGDNSNDKEKSAENENKDEQQENKSQQKKDAKEDAKVNSDYAKNVVNVFTGLLKADSLEAGRDTAKAMSYQPIQSIVSVQSIADMKFPQNIIFFIKQLISWIKNLVVYFIDKIRNFLSLLFRGKKAEPRVTPEDLKLNLERTQKLEMLNAVPYDKNTDKGKIIKMYNLPIDGNDIKEYIPLREAFADLFTGGATEKATNEKGGRNNAVVITVDLSRDMLQLKELVQHFYDLFDNAFGSNNEQLYDTSDLEMILKVFKDTLAGLKSGRTSVFQVGSNVGAIEAISSEKIRDNLVNTNVNITALKNAYMETKKKLNQTSSIITNKELLMANSMGVDFKILSSATYQEMLYILNTIEPRLKEAQKMERKLEVMQKAYTNVCNELKKVQQGVMSIGTVTYQSAYQRQFVDMFNASKYMTQIVTLRLTGLGTYIRELKDVQTIIQTLANLNRGNRR